MIRAIFVIMFICLCKLNVWAGEYPEIGKPCPSVILNNLKYHNKEREDIRKIKGKWVILDFWNKNCVACIEGFADTNKMQEKYKDKVEFFLIGRLDREKQIEKVYERFRRKLKLTLSICFDSNLHNRFNISGCPYIVIIDQKGIVRGLTFKFTEQDLQDFLANKEPKLQKAFRADEVTEFVFNPEKPLLINNNGAPDTEFIFRSVLAPWYPGNRNWRPLRIQTNIKKFLKPGFQVYGASLDELYLYAYFGFNALEFWDVNYGQYSVKPIFKISDSSKFVSNRATGEHIYSYSLIVPNEKKSTKFIQLMMQRDLKSYFGFDVRIEQRKHPCLNLIINDSSKVNLLCRDTLISESEYVPHSMLWVKHQTIAELLIQVFGSFQEVPLIDQTGIYQPITLIEEADMTDFNDIRKALQKYGLDLVYGEKEMKTLIISDDPN